LKNFGISRKGIYAFLNASSTRIVDSDNGGTHFHGLIHDFTNFLRLHFRKRTAKNCKILRIYVHKPTVDSSVTGYYSVAQKFGFIHAKISGTVLNKHIELFETAFVQKHRETFPCRVFSF
jgi:hypothetical protein